MKVFDILTIVLVAICASCEPGSCPRETVAANYGRAYIAGHHMPRTARHYRTANNHHCTAHSYSYTLTVVGGHTFTMPKDSFTKYQKDDICYL